MSQYNIKSLVFLTIALIIFQLNANAQFLSVSGQKIVNNAGNQEVVLNAMNFGNWMIMEGYMMNSTNQAPSQHVWKQKLTALLGTAKTKAFYDAWLSNHVTQEDINKIKELGFNSVRLPLHYEYFVNQGTPDVWNDQGFTILDNVLSWCKTAGIYAILDLHAAPGGQSDNAISDYDNSKPPLWGNEANKTKTVKLWRKLSDHYKNDEWVGGYDLINEPAWNLPNGTELRNMYNRLTDTIRTNGDNHILFIEGNWYANDYTGLTPAWDANMVYVFHKYWSNTADSDLKWVLDLRSNQNRPIWCGEHGENSNTHFTKTVELFKRNNIGMSWWPMKKFESINDFADAKWPVGYNDLLNYLSGTNPGLSPVTAYNTLMQLAENVKLANTKIQTEVLRSIFIQPGNRNTEPYVPNNIPGLIYATNYDMGMNEFAYFDHSSEDLHVSTGTYTAWNEGWSYRNDGVDIQKCTDNFQGGNGFSVGWTESGEWMQYTIDTDSIAAYTLTLRTAANSATPGEVQFSIEGSDISGPIALPNTGGWSIWQSTTTANVILPKGRSKVRFHFNQGGSNINLFSFSNPVNISAVPFNYLSAVLDTTGKEIVVTLNKDITELTTPPQDVVVMTQDKMVSISGISIYPGDNRKMIVSLNSALRFNDIVNISYANTSIKSGNLALLPFSQKAVMNNLPKRFIPPTKIEAENFTVNNGFSLETCTDVGGGQDISYAKDGNYLDYYLYVPAEGNYTLQLRVASLYGNGKITICSGVDSNFQTLVDLSIPLTGGWQTWTTVSVAIKLPAGNSTLRLLSAAGEYNLNWLNIAGPNVPTGIIDNQATIGSLMIFPNPGQGYFRMAVPCSLGEELKLNIRDLSGKLIYSGDCHWSCSETHEVYLSQVYSGLYLVQLSSPKGTLSGKLIIRQ